MKDSGSGSCSVHETGFLCSPSLVLESWRIHGELLAFSLHQNPEKVGFSTSCSNRADELASNSEGEQAKGKSSGDPTSQKVCPGHTDTSQDVGESPKQWELESLKAVSMLGTESCPRCWKQPSGKEPLLQRLHPLSQTQLMFS